MEPLLTVTDLKVRLNSQIIISDISFHLNKNETTAVIGPNGAGKTVLLKAILGLLPSEGKIEWQKGVKIGYVPQRVAVEADLPLTTAEFFRLKGVASKQTLEALTWVGFDKNVLGRKMGILSGGEFQRVLIAWALVGNPDVLLFDEPTSGVDISAEETIYGFLKKLQEKKQMAIMVISHDLNVVYRFATNVICLNKEMVCYGPPREVLDKDSLSNLYGENMGIYQHNHNGHDEH